MQIEYFLNLIKEELEIEDQKISLETRFDTLDIWDSVARLILISLVGERFGVELKAEDFKTISTVEELMNRIGRDQFDA